MMRRLLIVLCLLALPALMLGCAATGAGDPGNQRWVFVSGVALTLALQTYDWYLAASADGVLDDAELLELAGHIAAAVERLTGAALEIKVTPLMPLPTTTTTAGG